MNTALKQYLDTKFETVATKDDLQEIKDTMITQNDFANMNLATKDDLDELRSGLVSVLASKADVLEVKDIAQRLDRRTDQDTRAIIKDVERIKVVLNNSGFKIN